jgi:hypothetical protein
MLTPNTYTIPRLASIPFLHYLASMSSFYSDLRNVASGLLAEFGQGFVEIGRPVTVPGLNEWSLPTTSIQWQQINAVARGVSQKYIDGANIVATDLQLTVDMADFQPKLGDRIRIDGKEVSLLRIEPIPAAGLTVATRVFVRA